MINDAIRQIRDTVNTAVLIHNIERHGFQWDMVAASLDILGDTQLAIEAYQERQGKVGSDVGHGYLDAYGLFQAIFMQQDALTNLAEGLKLSRVRVHKNPDSAYVRNLRTKYFGQTAAEQGDQAEVTADKAQCQPHSKKLLHQTLRLSNGGGI